MKKVININFQGRVIPIEETAYDMLKQYVESLRRFFQNEEGRDEIINDIEGRIAELFGDNLKNGSTCITDVDVNAIIDSMGRPEDFDADEAKVQSQLGADAHAGFSASEEAEAAAPVRGRLYRDDQDKILGGVCSGLAHYLRIDPAIIRILFAVITFGGFGSGFLIYILMWAILPSKSLEKSAIRKRLFRNPEDKVFAGVASGVAAYFNIAVWIPRLIFAFPLVIGVVVSIFRNIFWDFDPFPSIFFGSFGSTFFIVYLILWIVIPEANSASEKLEMRGEKVDLNTIKNTIQEDLQGFKGRAEKWGKEVGAKAQEWGKEFGSTVGASGQTFSSEVGGAARRGGNRVFNAIGVIFKAFFLFIAGVIAFALSIALFMLLFRGVNIFPLKDFIITGFWPNTLALATLVFFIAVPIIALVTWVIRRVMKVRSRNSYLGYIFGGLWTIGLICAIILAATVAREFRRTASETESLSITQPANGKMIVSVLPAKDNFYTYEMFDDNSDGPMLSKNEDSLLLNTITIKFAKSLDSAFHVYAVRIAKGTTPVTAEENLKTIAFDFKQTDSIIYLPSGFAISRNQRFP
jgi:phage shock protein PspC (stress-responsive transcriptional regulator)